MPVDKDFQIVVMKTKSDEYLSLLTSAYKWKIYLIVTLFVFCVLVVAAIIITRKARQRLAEELINQN